MTINSKNPNPNPNPNLAPSPGLNPWSELKPRSLSFLPVARACQASCKFCFSDASISVEKKKRIQDFENLAYWCQRAAQAGAKRFVITGGGEPTIIGQQEILNALEIASQYFNNNILVTNGMHLSGLAEQEMIACLNQLYLAGLTTLAVSYHHYLEDKNAEIMRVNTQAERIFSVNRKIDQQFPNIRLMCVLQKEGINSQQEISNYLDFAYANNIKQVCFKELYVASKEESEYANTPANLYSAANQVPIQQAIDYCLANQFKLIDKLPWGCPLFYDCQRDIKVMCFYDPNVSWERKHCLSRSWNYMADNQCYASLEDMSSVIA